MSEEIVRRILSSKKKLVFESAEVFKKSEREDPIMKEMSEPILPNKEETPEEASKQCECGSSEFVVENGEEVCDHCGRKVSPSPVRESSKYTKGDILATALRMWNSGKYEKAMNLCKKYGVSDKEFVTHLMDYLKESKKEDENIIRPIQKPISTADKPSIDSSIIEAISK